MTSRTRKSKESRLPLASMVIRIFKKCLGNVLGFYNYFQPLKIYFQNLFSKPENNYNNFCFQLKSCNSKFGSQKTYKFQFKIGQVRSETTVQWYIPSQVYESNLQTGLLLLSECSISKYIVLLLFQMFYITYVCSCIDPVQQQFKFTIIVIIIINRNSLFYAAQFRIPQSDKLIAKADGAQLCSQWPSQG